MGGEDQEMRWILLGSFYSHKVITGMVLTLLIHIPPLRHGIPQRGFLNSLPSSQSTIVASPRQFRPPFAESDGKDDKQPYTKTL